MSDVQAPVSKDVSGWRSASRPGYFGKTRDEKIRKLTEEYGAAGWRLVWIVEETPSVPLIYNFEEACRTWYEASYVEFLRDNPKEVDFICSYGECYDNAKTNIQSGCDYTIQEALSTHIQDIAIRNALKKLGRKFEGPTEKLLEIRSTDSNGFKYGPGNVPFLLPRLITQPSKSPRWAKTGSVEDFWQSNKWIQVKEVQLTIDKIG